MAKPKRIQQRDPKTKRYLPIMPADQRNAIIEDALESLKRGERTEDIGERHGLTGACIRQWLLADDRADQARGVYFAGELAKARDEIQGARDPLSLARARESFRAVAWLAERRNARQWGQQSHVTIEQVGDLGDRLRRARERTIDGNATLVAESADVQTHNSESAE